MEQIYPYDYEKRLQIAQGRIHEADVKEQRALSLVGLGLEEIPQEVFSLTKLRELNIGKNQIKTIPEEISNLQYLHSLHVQQCQLTEFPLAVLSLKKIKILNLGRNKIRSIPEMISDLSELTTLTLSRNEIETIPSSIAKIGGLTTLELISNKIHTLPREIVNLRSLRRITLRGNPIKFPHSQNIKGIAVEQNALFQLLHHFINENVTAENSSKIELPEALRTAFQQYLVFFNDFVFKAKGQKIDIRVSQYESGLEITYSKSVDIDKMQDYLDEYIGFIKDGVDKINPEFEKGYTGNKEILLVELKNQVRHLTSQLEIKQVETKLLHQQINMFHEVLLVASQKQPIVVNANSNSISQASSFVQLEFKESIQALQNLFLSLKSELLPLVPEAKKSELELIDRDLLEIDDNETTAEKINKMPFKRLKRMIDQVNEKDSDWNKFLSASKKGVSYLQAVAKQYNKIAPWLGIPSVPDQLLQ